MGLRGLSFGPERADFGFQRADFGLERADLGPERGLGGDVRTDVRTSGNSPLCPTGHRPFGAAAQKQGWIHMRGRLRLDRGSYAGGLGK